MRIRPTLLLVCALIAAPSASLYAANAPRPVRPPATVRKPAHDNILLDFGGWLRERALALGNPFGASSTSSSPAPAAATIKPLCRSECPIG